MRARLDRRRGAAPAVELAVTHVARRDRGATATEYALLVGFIALVIAVAVQFFGDSLSTFYHNIASSMSTWL